LVNTVAAKNLAPFCVRSDSSLASVAAIPNPAQDEKLLRITRTSGKTIDETRREE
jgi:hypothetical protein